MKMSVNDWSCIFTIVRSNKISYSGSIFIWQLFWLWIAIVNQIGPVLCSWILSTYKYLQYFANPRKVGYFFFFLVGTFTQNLIIQYGLIEQKLSISRKSDNNNASIFQCNKTFKASIFLALNFFNESFVHGSWWCMKTFRGAMKFLFIKILRSYMRWGWGVGNFYAILFIERHQQVWSQINIDMPVWY